MIRENPIYKVIAERDELRTKLNVAELNINGLVALADRQRIAYYDAAAELDTLRERLAKADTRILDLETRVALRDVIVVELTEERDELRKCVKERDATGYDEAYARLVQIEKEVAELKEKLVEAE